MALNDVQRKLMADVLGTKSDEYLAHPLWLFAPSYRPLIQRERQRRGILQSDPEPTGDPEYS